MRNFLSAYKNSEKCCENGLSILDEWEAFSYADNGDLAFKKSLIRIPREKEEIEAFKQWIYKEYCEDCPKKEACKLISYRILAKKNVVLNYFKCDDEIIIFKNALTCIEDARNLTDDITNGFVKIDGVLYPRKENMTNQKFLENMHRSANASLDRFYGYALMTEWKYFVTLTTDKIKVQRYDDESVKRLIGIFGKALKRWDKNAVYLIAPERHKDGALHFHGFINSEKDLLLRLAKDRHSGKQLYTKLGEPLFEFDLWRYGIATCAVIAPGVENLRQVANYMIAYVTKLDDIGYRGKRFYRSQSLPFKDKAVVYMDDFAQIELLDGAEFYKELDNCYIYRKKNKK